MVSRNASKILKTAHHQKSVFTWPEIENEDIDKKNEDPAKKMKKHREAQMNMLSILQKTMTKYKAKPAKNVKHC